MQSIEPLPGVGFRYCRGLGELREAVEFIRDLRGRSDKSAQKGTRRTKAVSSKEEAGKCGRPRRAYGKCGTSRKKPRDRKDGVSETERSLKMLQLLGEDKEGLGRN